jgi:formylglycine-generating enzyme required for sulfatase activity
MGSLVFDQGPQRRVTITRPYAVGKFEATFAEWDACVTDGGCTYRPGDERWGRDKRPVINVSWNHITQQYLPWLSRRTGKTYRLLTEAEWEYAARAETTTRFAFGDNQHDLCTYANAADLAAKASLKGRVTVNCNDGYVTSAPVGSFRPNAFGLYDMHGNVIEWVQDCYNTSYSGAPSDAAAWTRGDCANRMLRGGSWYSHPLSLSSANRDWSTTRVWANYIGFRVARTL